jgi:hypothetical protein
MATTAPVETKVVAASTSAALATFVVAWLGAAVFGGDPVPSAVVGLVNGAVAAAAAFAAGWLAKHTPREGTGPQPPTTGVQPPTAGVRPLTIGPQPPTTGTTGTTPTDT